MGTLPTGTVTFLFTDVEGSTRLLHEQGTEAYAQALTEHRRVIRAACAAQGGVEVDTQGDAFFVSFRSAHGALAAALAITDGLSHGPVRVRIGIHTGTPHLVDGGYVGTDVHRAARIAAAGHGGQVLVSAETRSLVDGDLTDLGEHRLKDFTEAVAIYQVGAERFPPLRTISNTNLPRPASSFVGRAGEVEELAALLRDGARLLTLTGPGGSGKTRLAIEVAASLVPRFKAGVFWIPLAPLRDPALVTETIGQTIGSTEDLADHIGQREMLLVVDNLEQVIAAASHLAALVEACPGLRLLVTSRERLRVRGEVERPVAPLAEPDAVTLFCERARVEPDATVHTLCRALDNLPLAIELAAARASVLSPAQIEQRLAQRLDLLKGGRDAEPRQQTLRAAIEWSYDLLAPAEQRLVARLAAFRGGATLEAAEHVAAADLDALSSLVDKSLVRQVDGRFVMLETIREFAAERLEASGEGDAIRQRHAGFFLALVEAAEPHLRSPEPKEWQERLGSEADNLRAALDRLEGWADGDRLLRMAGALDEFWCPRNEQPEGRRYLETALRIGQQADLARVRALVAAAHLARDDADPSNGRTLAEEALRLSRELGDELGAGRATLWLGACLADGGQFDRARLVFEEASGLLAEAGDSLNALFATRLLAWMHYELGDRKRARTLHEANLRRARELGSRDLEASILGALAEYAVDDGRIVDAATLGADALRTYLELEDRHGVAVEMVVCADALAAARQVEAAVRVLACSMAWYDEAGTSPMPYQVSLIERVRGSGVEKFGEEGFAAAWATGQQLVLEEGAGLAIEALRRIDEPTKDLSQE